MPDHYIPVRHIPSGLEALRRPLPNRPKPAHNGQSHRPGLPSCHGKRAASSAHTINCGARFTPSAVADVANRCATSGLPRRGARLTWPARTGSHRWRGRGLAGAKLDVRGGGRRYDRTPIYWLFQNGAARVLRPTNLGSRPPRHPTTPTPQPTALQVDADPPPRVASPLLADCSFAVCLPAWHAHFSGGAVVLPPAASVPLVPVVCSLHFASRRCFACTVPDSGYRWRGLSGAGAGPGPARGRCAVVAPGRALRF